MERFDRLKESFYRALNEKNYKEAKDIIDDFGPSNDIESRVKLHYEGRYLAALGLYGDAIEQMRLTELRFGNNIQITKDLASLYRQVGDERAWIETTNRLTDDFNSIQKNLSLVSRHETLVQLFNERVDQGFVSIATKIFERIERENLPEPFRVMIRKARLRVQMLLNDPPAQFSIEPEALDLHTKVLMSCFEGSHGQSIKALEGALKSVALTTHAKAHLFFDFLDLHLVRGIIPDTLFSHLDAQLIPQPVTYFELNLQSLMQSLLEPRPIYWFKYISSSDKISLFDELRILTLQSRYGNERVKTFANFQIHLRLEKLDMDSQIFWSKRLKLA